MATAKKTAASTKPAPIQRRPVARQLDTVPTYKVTEQSYINNMLVGPGTPHLTVQYWGVPGKALIPLNAAAKANKLAARDVRAEHKGDPEATREALHDLDNDMQGVTNRGEDYGDADLELTDADRAELGEGESAAEEEKKDA